jgi:hypothetical protein
VDFYNPDDGLAPYVFRNDKAFLQSFPASRAHAYKIGNSPSFSELD